MSIEKPYDPALNTPVKRNKLLIILDNPERKRKKLSTFLSIVFFKLL